MANSSEIIQLPPILHLPSPDEVRLRKMVKKGLGLTFPPQGGIRV